jgi:flagellar hook-associated protein 1
MSDLISMGSSGVLAYQRALSTVSNNIANIGTDGYSRQDVNLASSMPRSVGIDYIGTGVYTTGVKRAYDAFVESNLRNSSSDLQGQGPVVQYANRLVDIMASDNTGLSGSLTAFFGAARDLGTEPSSVIARGAFLSKAEGLASGFRQMEGQIQGLDAEVRAGLDIAANKINALSEQIALVNKQLFKQPTLDRQPPELLDQRDNLLRELAKLVRIDSAYTPNGQVRISINGNTEPNSGAFLVNDDVTQRFALRLDGNTGRLDMGLNLNTSREKLVNNVAGGEVGGLLAVREQVVQPALDRLNALAQALITDVNAVHRDGIDAEGLQGQDLFGVRPAGANAAAGMQLLITEAQSVAAASPLRVVTHELNVGTARASVTFEQPELDLPPALSAMFAAQQAFLPTGTRSTDQTVELGSFNGALTLDAGTRDAVIYFDVSRAQADQWPQVITRDGRHLMGQALSEAQQALLLDKDTLVAGASYSSQYLNAEKPTQAYLQASYMIGAKAEPTTAPVYDLSSDNPHGVSSLTPVAAKIQAALSELGTLGSDAIAADALRLNGVSLSAYSGLKSDGVTPGTLADVAAWINSHGAGTPASPGIPAIPPTGVLASVVTQDGQESLVLTATSTSQDVVLTFGENGSPADLSKLGIRTGVYWDGKVPEDLLVFMTDASGNDPTVNIAFNATFAPTPFNLRDALREQPFDVVFGKDQGYTIVDVKTGTELASRTYDPHVGTIEYQGVRISLSQMPAMGDRFRVDGNHDGSGNNANIKALAELEFKRSDAGTTFTESYLNQTSQVGNVARQAKIAQEALTVVHAQAMEARESLAGVSLDEEAANLIRFQQAYQANAKVMQTANTLFDALINIR